MGPGLSNPAHLGWVEASPPLRVVRDRAQQREEIGRGASRLVDSVLDGLRGAVGEARAAQVEMALRAPVVWR